MIKISKIFLSFFILYWLPFIWVYSQYKPISSIEKLPSVDAVIVFGTLVHNNAVSPLLKERLDASISVYTHKKVNKIVVSNTKNAAKIMSQYLQNSSISSKSILMDIHAEKTTDTCKYEKKNYNASRKLIFISQGYHLPRIAYQCKKIGISATLFPAETIHKNRKSFFSSWDVFTTRIKRYLREAGLTWLALLNIYT